VVRTFLSARRRRWRAEVPFDQVPDRVATGDSASEVANRDALWRALRRLPARQRAIVVLRYFEDLSERQIADLLGVRTGTVKSQASKALAHLRLDESLRTGTVLNGVRHADRV
jgi:RNA polymerase sigma factor (sigma-70 family)